MKIALLSEYFPRSQEREMRGGVEARAYFIARELAKKHDVTVYSAKEEAMSDSSEFDGINVVRVKPEVRYSQAGSLYSRFLFMRNLAKELKHGGYDVVDGLAVLTYLPAWYGGEAKRVITYHDLWVGRWVRNVGYAGVFGEVLERMVLSKRWDRIIAVSRYTKKNLIGYGIPDESVSVVPNGIDLGEYKKIKAEKFNKPTVCAVARLVKYKRLDDLLNALARIRDDIPDIQAKIIGCGPELQSLRDTAIKNGLGECVDFMGYVEKHDDVLKVMKASHAVCLPSVVEGFGITVVEAMALGVPYVASDIGAVREATEGGVGGVLYQPGDVEGLTSSLTKVLRGGVRGGSKNISGYDWSRRAKKVEEVYEGLF
ncbi:MAG: glycosyltransferase family 4 protein [Candidatus Altiarchaeota archaeon]|nr:glycosyltransferase family 4 protein [Candidatus Altiarchaeota archaeon]